MHSKGKGGNHTQAKQNDKVFAPQIVQQKPLFQSSQPPAMFGNNFVPPGSAPGSAPFSMSSLQGSNAFGVGSPASVVVHAAVEVVLSRSTLLQLVVWTTQNSLLPESQIAKIKSEEITIFT